MSPSKKKARGGIDLGGTKIQTVVVDRDNEVLGEARTQTPREGGPPAIAEAMAGCLATAAEDAGYGRGELKGIGVGSPGEVDNGAGTVSSARNLSGWLGTYELAADLSERLGAPVSLGNDVQVATTAEFELGAGREFDTVLGVFWGTGVGGGIVLDGKDWLGRGAAGEIGHMVVKRGGRRCPCGNKGCMEAYAGRAAMEARARKLKKKGRKTKLFKLMKAKGKDRLTSSVWEKAHKHDDPVATELIDEAIVALGAGVASAVNLLDVECVILGGGLGVRFGERLGPRIEERMHKSLFTDEHPPAFEVAALGDLGGAIGAALLAR
ncbi:MAG TPA: ROK family protein [Solirubrobacterales bacterium]|nr:ROK family protein [Solirubrobacterales bacterium]